MILTPVRIELQNFMTHRQEAIDLPEQGIVLLWGPSGAGKSSLLDAIGWTFFGVDATRAKSIDELRHELYPDEDMGVRITYSLGDDRRVQIYRGVESGRSVAWMADADGTLIEGLAAVKARVTELLGGMDGATFFATYFSQQGELDALVRKPGSERRKFVQKITGVTLLDKVGTHIRRTSDKLSERLKFIDESMPKQSKDELSDQLSAARQRVDAAAAHVQDLQAALEAAKVRGVGLKAKLDEQQHAAQRHRELGPQITVLRDTQIPAIETELARAREQLTEAQAAAARLLVSAGVAKNLTDLQTEADRLSAAEGALQALQRLQEDVQVAVKLVEEREAELQRNPAPAEVVDPADAASELERMRSKLAVCEQQLTEKAANRTRLADDHECFTCLRPLPSGDQADQALSALDEQIAELTAEQTQLQQSITAAQQRVETLRAAAQAAQQQQRAHEQARTLHEEAVAAEQRTRRQLDEATAAGEGGDSARLKHVRAELAELAQVAAGLDRDRALAQQAEALTEAVAAAEQQLKQTREQLAACETELTQLNFDADAYAQAEKDIEQARHSYTDLVGQVERARAEEQSARRDVTDAEQQLKRYDELVGERRATSEQHVLLQKLDGSMKEFKAHLIGQLRPSLEALTSRHLSELTDGRMPAVKIDEDYNLFIKRHGEFKRIGLCSGGERARAAFALRLALTQLVSGRTDTPIGFIVFDEIFGSQDDDHRKAILDSLAALRGLYPQTFLISHEESLRDSPYVDVIVDVPDADSVGRIQVTHR